MLNFALIQTPPVKIGKIGKISELIWTQSSTLPLQFLDFRYIAPSGKQSASKSTGIENQGKISHL